VKQISALIISPGASWSTADVCAGLMHGLEAHGVKIFQYRLDARIDRSNRWLYAAWRSAKRKNPDITKPTSADVFYQAGIGALEMALRAQVDLVLVVSAMYLHPDVLHLMSRAGIKVAVLFTESPYDLTQELKIAQLISGCWTNERSSLKAFRQVQPMSGYLPHGWHPDRHKPGPQPGDEAVPAHDVVFVGSAFQERIAWLSDIDWRGVNLGLYGMWNALGSRHPLRQFVRGQVTANTTTAALYRRCKIGLNLYRTSMGWGKKAPQIAHAESLNPRAYELAACGVFHLSNYRAEVSDVFGDLVPTFESPAEASALIRDWLKADDERDLVAKQLPTCVRDMSWMNRTQAVVKDIERLLHPRAVTTSSSPAFSVAV
jgi:spore maturation protein CgeB